MSFNNITATNSSNALFDAGDFVQNKRVVSNNQILYFNDPVSGLKCGYIWKGSVPHVTSTNNPSTDGGISATAWMPIIYSGLKEKMASEGLTLNWSAHLPTVEVAYGLPKNSLKIWTQGSVSTSTDYWLYTDGTVWNGVGTLGSTPASPFEQITPNFNASIKTYTATAADGQTIFNVPFSFTTINVFVNGSLQIQGISYDVSGSTVTFSTPLEANDIVYAFLGNPNITVNDKVNKIYTTVGSQGQTQIQVPYSFSTALVYINGVLQNPSSSYSIGANNIITLAGPLYQDDEVVVMCGDVIIPTDDYVLKNELSLSTASSAIGTNSGLTIQETIDSSGSISILNYIDPTKWKYLNNPTTAENMVGDLTQIIIKAMQDSAASGKDLIFCGPQVGDVSTSQSFYFPISTPLNQVEGCSIRSTGIGKNYLIPTADFPQQSFLLSWAPGLGQPRMFIDGLGFSGGNYRQKNIGALRIQRGVYTSVVKNIFIRDCYYGGILVKTENVSGQTQAADLVNFNIDTVFILNSGHPSYYQAVDIQLSSEWGSGNWTDGALRNIDVSLAYTDNTSITQAPVSLNIYNFNRQIFNVLFERFYTSSKSNTHVKVYSNSNIRNTNLSFQNFSGDGIVKTALPMIDIDGLGWSNFSNMYRGSLINGGLSVKTASQCIFSNMIFGAETDANSNYQPQLTISNTCENLIFRDCMLRNMYNTNSPYQYREWFTTWMRDDGINTLWDSAQISSNVIVKSPFSLYNTVTSGKCTNALTQNVDIVATQNADNLQLSYPNTSSSASPTISFPVPSGYSQGTNGDQYLYILMKVKFISATLGTHFLRANVYGTNIDLKPDTLNKDYTIVARVTINKQATNQNLILTLGSTAGTTEQFTCQISEISLTSGPVPWIFNYRKTLQVI